MDISVSVRNSEEPAVLRAEVVTCNERLAIPSAGESRPCGIPGCMRVIDGGLFGSVSNNNAPCESQRLRQELLKGRFTPPSLEI